VNRELNLSAESNLPEVDDLDIHRLAGLLWAGKLWLIFFALFGLAMVVFYLHATYYKFTSAIMVVPTSSSSPSLPGELGGLASLAGISLGNSSEPFQEYFESILSLDVSEQLAADPEILIHVFPDEWDPIRHQWREPVSGFRPAISEIKKLLGVPVLKWSPPDARRLQEHLSRELIIFEIPKKTVLQLSYEHREPAFSAYLLLRLHKAADEHLRKRTLERTRQYIDYLTSRLRIITVAEYRQAIAELLSSQEKLRMVASAEVSYAAEPIGLPITSIAPTSPKPLVIIPAGLFGGSLFGAFVAVARGWRRHSRRRFLNSALQNDGKDDSVIRHSVGPDA
jgi:uncharacterized protein involved in exopolysaccharide biosynthesis